MIIYNNNTSEYMEAKLQPENDFLVLKGVNKTFYSTAQQQTKAIDDFNVSIKRGEFLTLLGPSGCGITTILRILAGLDKADSGDILLDGKSINDIPTNQRNMPLIFQSYALFPHLTVFENIAYGLTILNKSAQLIKNDVEMILHVVNLAGLENRYPNELSGGQQQRTAIARALILKPSIILFDEPLSSLDMKLRAQTRLEIKQIQQTLGITAVYVTHDQEEALSIADRIVVMDNGNIVQTGSPTEIYNNPNNVFVAELIGDSNFIEAMIIKISSTYVSVSYLGQRVDLPLQKHHDQFTVNEKVYLAIKPEAVIICDTASLSGIISKISFLGHNIQYEIELGNSFISARAPNTLPNKKILQEGNIVSIDLPKDFLHILKI